MGHLPTLIATFILVSGLPALSQGSRPKTKEGDRTLRPQQAPATATERRVALVIGNGAYAEGALRNPPNDARAMGEALRTLGFEVEVITDASRKRMLDAVREFGRKLTAGGVGLFYYAGHGMQVKGANYLIPVGVDIATEEDVQSEALDANTVLSRMDAAKNQANLVILDACRNNPFARSFRSGTRGLAQMEAPSGTFVAFATAPGSTASDGDGQNGLYTQHLLQSMKVPGLSVEDVFKRVRISVKQASRDQQVPWDSSSLTGEFFFKPGSPQDSAIEPAPVPAPTPVVVARTLDEWMQWQRQFDEAQELLQRSLADLALTSEAKQKLLVEALDRWQEDNPHSDRDNAHRAWMRRSLSGFILRASKARHEAASTSLTPEGLAAWKVAEADKMESALKGFQPGEAWVARLRGAPVARGPWGTEPLEPALEPTALSPLERIVEAHTQARGGVAALNAVSSFQVVRDFNGAFTYQWDMVAPDRFRYIDQFHALMGGYLIVVGRKGSQAWMHSTNKAFPAKNGKLLTERESKVWDLEIHSDLPSWHWEGPLVRYEQTTGTLNLEGQEVLDGVACYKILGLPRRESAMKSRFWVDSRTHQLVKESQFQGEGERAFLTWKYSDFRPVGGLVLPHQIEYVVEGSLFGGTTTPLVYKVTYRVNPALPESFFEMATGAKSL